MAQVKFKCHVLYKKRQSWDRQFGPKARARMFVVYFCSAVMPISRHYTQTKSFLFLLPEKGSVKYYLKYKSYRIHDFQSLLKFTHS